MLSRNVFNYNNRGPGAGGLPYKFESLVLKETNLGVVQVLLDHKHISTQYDGVRSYYHSPTSYSGRPVRAVRVTRGSLEPSANFCSANFPDKLDKWRHIRNRRGRLGTRLSIRHFRNEKGTGAEIVTVPEAFAKVNLAQFPGLFSKLGNYHYFYDVK